MHKELKKEIDKVYAILKMQKVHYFAFIHLTFLTKNIDVNIHPQKSEVRFLNEEKVIKQIAKTIAAKLEKVPESPKKPLKQVCFPAIF
jgi:DNA mismatch repair protein MutL